MRDQTQVKTDSVRTSSHGRLPVGCVPAASADVSRFGGAISIDAWNNRVTVGAGKELVVFVRHSAQTSSSLDSKPAS